MHQVLERYHSQLANEEAWAQVMLAEPGPERLMTLYETGWRRSRLRRLERGAPAPRTGVASASSATRSGSSTEEGSPVWFERFAFRSARTYARAGRPRGPAPDGSYELIDYKTGRAADPPSQLKEDIQLSLYQMGARESWKLDSARQSYYYVLDDEKVPVQPSEEDGKRIEDTAREVAEGISRSGSSPRRPTRRARSATIGSRARRPSADERSAAPRGQCDQPLVRRAGGAAGVVAAIAAGRVRRAHRRERQRQVDRRAHDRRPARADGGTVRVCGHDPHPEPDAEGARAALRSCPTRRCSTTT